MLEIGDVDPVPTSVSLFSLFLFLVDTANL